MNFSNDELANSLIIHAAGTKALLDNQEPVHGNTRAMVIAHMKGITMPAENTYFRNPAGQVFLFLNGRKRRVVEIPRETASFLRPGEALRPGESRRSSTIRLLMQEDGNLVVYRKLVNAPMWASNTVGRGAVALMQEDGNFVIYDAANRPVWATNTAGRPGAHLLVQEDGNVVLYLPGGRPIWDTGTRAPAEADPGDIPANLPVLPDDLIDALDEDIPYAHVKGAEQPERAVPAAPEDRGGGGFVRSFYRRQMMGFDYFADVLYTVQSGDTLTQIAIDHGLCQQPSGNTRAAWAPCLAAAQKIAELNKLPSVNAIQAGQTLVLISEPVVATPNLPPPPSLMKQAGFGGYALWGAIGLAVYWGAVGGNSLKAKKARRRRPTTSRRRSRRR